MIGCLQGKLRERDGRIALILTTGGVGYEVEVTDKTLNFLESEQEIFLYTYFIVREDTQKLYGFLTRHEKDLFHLLLKVNGVGGKVALSILDSYSVSELFAIIYGEDTKSLQKISGLGKKTADRLVLEMKDLLKKIQQGSEVADIKALSTSSSHIDDAKSALLVLGFKSIDIDKRLSRIPESEKLTTEELIKVVLQGKSG